MRSIATLVVAVAAFVFAPNVAWSQLVRVYRGAGVSVRAPFVRVQVSPDGQRSVRAPFVTINTPGRTRVVSATTHGLRTARQTPTPARLEQPRSATPPRPTPTESLLDRTRRQLAQSARDLERELMRLDTGSEWLRPLRLPDEIVIGQSGADRGAPLPPSTVQAPDESVKQLVDVLARFDAVSRNPEYEAVREMPVFKRTHSLLETYVSLLGPAPSEDRPDGPQPEEVPTPAPQPSGPKLF